MAFYFFLNKWWFLFIWLWASEQRKGLDAGAQDQYPQKADRFLWALVLYRVLIGLLCGFSWMRVCIPETPGCYISQRAKEEIKTQSSWVQNQLWMAGIHSALRGVHDATGEQAASAANQREPSPWKQDWYGPVRQRIMTLTSREPGCRRAILISPLLYSCHEAFLNFLLNID